MKLHQALALVAGQKSRTASEVTEAYHKIQKPDLLKGISRRYTPKDDDGEVFPPESNQVVYRVPDALDETRKSLATLFDLVLMQDATNCLARADVEIDGFELLSAVPVTNLLFLEKQVKDLHSLIEKLPTLDPSERWRFDPNSNAYVTEPSQQTKTKKVSKVLVKYPATVEHPAQTEMVTEDVVVGSWETIKFSGAIPELEKKNILRRVQKLWDAIKMAREEANSTDAVHAKIGELIFDYVFGKSGTNGATAVSA